MKVKNLRPYPVYIVGHDVDVEAGGTVDVPDDVGRSLVEQSDAWQAVSNKAVPAVTKEKN
jgi:hypothetical protein